jgi:iron complex transport system substrate-binding protein
VNLNRYALAAVSWLAVAPPISTEAADNQPPQRPSRVVSMNLCTDQLASLVARDDQLYSISYLSLRRDVSPMYADAGGYRINYGRAEEIFLMRPDVVLSGAFSKPTTVSMLRRLGIRVELFEPAASFAGIQAAIVKMGRVLGRREAAAQVLSAFNKEVAELARQPALGKRAAMYYANSYTSGGETLAAEIVKRAGLENLGSQLGFTGTVKLPLEVLVMGRPDLIVGGRGMTKAKSRSFEIVNHPAVRALTRNHAALVLSDQYWICGTPFTLRAVKNLAATARKAFGEGKR